MKGSRRAIKSAQIKVRQLFAKIIAGTRAAICASATDITHGSDLFEYTAHGFITGDKVQVSTSSALPTGLSASTNYWVLKIDDDSFKLCDTYAHAIAGTDIVDITDNGTGNQTFTQQEKLGGLDANNLTLVAKEKGKYTINISDEYRFLCGDEDVHAQATSMEADKCPHIETTENDNVVVHISDIDETAALNDGTFTLTITGSDSTDRWF